MLNEMDNMHRMYCTIGCNRTITNDYIGLTLLPNSLLLAGWNDASKQKENAQRHCQSMHTIQVTQITALLRCGITTQKNKRRFRTKRSSRDICSFINRATQSWYQVRTAARRASHIYFFVLANASSDTACCMCLPALRCIIPGAFHISL